jgi:hypothetical protein
MDVGRVSAPLVEPMASLLMERHRVHSPLGATHVLSDHTTATAAVRAALESINARIRRAVKARSHFPTEQAAMTCVYLAVMSLDPTGKGRQRWTNRWKAALNAFPLAFPRGIMPQRK